MKKVTLKVEFIIPNAEETHVWEGWMMSAIRKTVATVIRDQSYGTVSYASAQTYVKVRPVKPRKKHHAKPDSKSSAVVSEESSQQLSPRNRHG